MIRLLHFALYGVASLLIGIGVLTAFGRTEITSSINELINREPDNNRTVINGQWPPRVGLRYPDLLLTDQNGDQVALSDFAGKVILLELAAIPCKGCQAFAGGNKYGGFDGIGVQKGLDSIHEYAQRFAGVTLGENEQVVFVQLLLYGKDMSSPSQDDVSHWAAHFKMKRDRNQIVLRGDNSMLGQTTYEMIPGFHLIDRDFTLRCDSSGHHPKQDLFRDLLPQLGQFARPD